MHLRTLVFALAITTPLAAAGTKAKLEISATSDAASDRVMSTRAGVDACLPRQHQ